MFYRLSDLNLFAPREPEEYLLKCEDAEVLYIRCRSGGLRRPCALKNENLYIKTRKQLLPLDIIPCWEYNISTEVMYIMKYISATEAAKRWDLSRRRIIALCHDGRIRGAQKAGAYWIIPETAEKPSDARVKSGKYIHSDGAEKNPI